MGLFNRNKKKPEIREDTTPDAQVVSNPLLRSLLGEDGVDRDTVMNIPAIAACINMIADTVSALKIKLYKRNGDRIEEVTDDPRTFLLNDDTGDALDAVQFKKAMVVDMFLSRGGYTFVNWIGGQVRSIHYVEAERIGFRKNTDPIFKDYQLEVGGYTYEPWQFIKLLRNTRNGCYGKPITEESPELMDIIYSSQKYEKNLVKTGGNKKGFIKSPRSLTQKALDSIKAAFKKLYQNNTENVVVLNNGLEFQESSNTSVEMQLNENKQTNSNECCKMLGIPSTMLSGGGNEEDDKKFIKYCVTNLLDEFMTAINKVLLLESEKGQYFFAPDMYELTKGDIDKRYNAYKTATDSGWLQVDEVRERENMEPLGMNMIKLGLQDVLYDPKTQMLYVPNTNQMHKLGEGGNEEGELK